MPLRPLMLAVCAALLPLIGSSDAVAKGFDLPGVDYVAERFVQGGERWQSMRVHYSPGKERMELRGAAAEGNVMIVRYDRGVTWLLMPRLRSYMELPADVGARLTALGRSLDLQPLGTEPVNGISATKYRVTGDLDGHIWLTGDGIPVRIDGEALIDGRPMQTRVEQRGILRSRPDPALFEVPPGYARIQLNDPRLLGLLQQMMPGR